MHSHPFYRHNLFAPIYSVEKNVQILYAAPKHEAARRNIARTKSLDVINAYGFGWGAFAHDAAQRAWLVAHKAHALHVILVADTVVRGIRTSSHALVE